MGWECSKPPITEPHPTKVWKTKYNDNQVTQPEMKKDNEQIMTIGMRKLTN